ncbi:hypothetical protein ES332_D08G090500v1 [Gossypium tomentosum]|uniref:Glutathione peroxidase n=1 Tax=Gossypium tomentosum TaxID=34277 RepID=A0A5D2JRL4_GOSTO|nr:hypothetical protein ES332_D08G090500v1 [Gossypium tomentosum]
MYWDWKFSNLVSLLFLGFALFLYFQFHTYPSPSSPLHIDNMAEDASPESIYDFSVKFGGQEPGTNEQIQEATCSMFKAEFPIFVKVEVNGKNAAPLYRFLKSEKGGYFGDAIKWNFTKFLVNKEGKVVERYAPTTSPLNIEKDIRDLLGSS